ncbi:MAG: ThuA domain-containing protein [Armatimonadetes bacterium]|nr:ThuA domain-containing protein [Armatimonadota bacterium]
MQPQPIKVLVLSGGVIHDYRGCGNAIVNALSEDESFNVTCVEDDLDMLKFDKLEPFDVLVLFYTGGTLTDEQRFGLLKWVSSGRGFVGIHSAADSFRDCPEYRAMLGGHFVTHPPYRQYQVSIVEPSHPITDGLDEFMVTDEQYILDYDRRVRVLATALYRGEAMPVMWVKPWGKGNVFYLALGHDARACQDENFKLLLRRGTKWVASQNV